MAQMSLFWQRGGVLTPELWADKPDEPQCPPLPFEDMSMAEWADMTRAQHERACQAWGNFTPPPPGSLVVRPFSA
jgi:hypothetical protein